MLNDIEKSLFNEKQIKNCVAHLAEEINTYYGDSQIIAIIVLKGSLFFASDLLRLLNMEMKIECINAKSYGEGANSAGSVTVKNDLDYDIAGKEILLIEDIADTGLTLSTLKAMYVKRGAKSVKVAVMLNKPARRTVEFEADFTGFTLPDEFVVGYGLDYNQKYRNLPFIGVLKREIYE